jgi:hypothetical protein
VCELPNECGFSSLVNKQKEKEQAMSLFSKLFGSPEPESVELIGVGDGDDQGILLLGGAEYHPPASSSLEEAQRVAAECKKRPGVADARPVTFAGSTHVHIDYYDQYGRLGDIGVINPDGEKRVEITKPDPWWKLW